MEMRWIHVAGGCEHMSSLWGENVLRHGDDGGGDGEERVGESNKQKITSFPLRCRALDHRNGPFKSVGNPKESN